MQLFYTVRTGDTLFQISSRWELPIDSLIAASNIMQPYMIYPGQQLSIPPGVDVIRVQPGDTVFKLSQRFGVPQTLIIEANNLQSPYEIRAGQLLKIPPGVPYYIVQSGDTLFQIAKRYNVITRGQINFELIRQVNSLPTNTIFPGMKLQIPYAPPGVVGLIAYTSNRGGSFDIWVYNPLNGLNIPITNGLGEIYSVPVWSPDSSSIAFVGRNGILYVVHLAQGTVAQIDQFQDGLGVRLDWSPDSQKLAYTKLDDIVMYNVITHLAKRINQPGATDVQWFSSGKELLFQAPDLSGISQLFRIQTNGTNKQSITRNTEGPLHDVSLSPDGMFALYTTPGVSISIIYTVEIATGNVFEVRGGPLAKNYFPKWSPNSTKISYSATAFEERGYFSLIRISGRRGENDRTFAISDCFATPVSWSPDGQKIGYLSGCNGQGIATEMWLFDLTHPVPIRLVEGTQITSLQWSPTPVNSLRKTFINTTYKVQFKFPSNWKQVNEERYEGKDGFFQISAISGASEIQEICHNEAFHPLIPYGTQPRIQSTQILNQEACFIYPSEDQPAEMREQAALIVKYPKPIQIQGTFYNYFILWADQGHINEISTTIVFLVN